MPKRPFMIAVFGLALAGLCGAGGCVPSKAAEYEDRMAAVIAPEHGASDDVAIAFGLQPQPSVAVAAMRDR